MGIRQILSEWMPPAYYSDGTISTRKIFRICSMFDPLDYSQSFKQVKKETNMEESNFMVNDGPFHIGNKMTIMGKEVIFDENGILREKK